MTAQLAIPMPLARGAMAKRLRWYQDAAATAAVECRAPSCLLVLATGTGKSVIGSEILRRRTGPALWLAGRTELVRQAQGHLEGHLGEAVGIEQAELSADGLDCRVVVGSVPTCAQPDRLERLTRRGFETVIVDEAHHAVAASWARVIRAFGSAKVIGLTATPNRADERALGQIFEEVGYIFDLRRAIEAGYLVPFVGARSHVRAVDIDAARTSAGDLRVGDLDEIMLKNAMAIVDSTIKTVGDRQTIVFAPGVRSAAFVTERLRALGKRAAFVYDGTPPDERRDIFEDMRAARLQFLVNCMIATEGVDIPTLSAVVIARPTLSRALYSQMIGRGSRPLASVIDQYEEEDGARRRAAIADSAKPDCLIVDMAGASAKHDPASLEDVLGGDYTDGEVRRAKALSRASKGGDPLAHLDAARREMAAAARILDAKVDSVVEMFDVLGVKRESVAAIDRRFGRVAATYAQVRYLQSQGIADASKLSKREASSLIDAIERRRKRGMAEPCHVRILERHGVRDPQLLPLQVAQAAIAYLYDCGLHNAPAGTFRFPKTFSKDKLNEILSSRQ